MKKLALLGAVAAVSATTFAEPIQWIGTGEVACWTNAANWAGGVVPGRYTGPDGEETGAAGAEVVFPVGSVEQTIDLDGLVSVFNATVSGSGTGCYTFGTSATQVLRLEDLGVFEVASDVARAPVLVGAVGRMYTTTGGLTANQPIIRNNSSDTLVIHDIGYIANYSSWGVCYFTFEGSGDIRFEGTAKSCSLLGTTFRQTGRFVLNTNLSTRCNLTTSVAEMHVEVAEGCTFRINADGYNNGLVMQAAKGKPISIEGEGTFTFNAGRTEGTSDPNRWSNSPVSVGYGLNVIRTAHIRGADNMSNSGHLVGVCINASETAFDGWATGTLVLDSPDNTLCGDIEIHSAAAIQASSFGLKGEQSRLGYCTNFYLCNKARLIYTGPGETTDRNIHVGRTPHVIAGGGATFKEATFSIEHAGTGPFVVNSTIDTAEDNLSPVMTLKNSTAETATWAADLVCPGLGIVKEGTGIWILSGANTYDGPTTVSAGILRVTDPASLANSSAITLAGGTLEIPGSETATVTTLKALNASANARLDVGYGRTLEFASISVASGKTLAIVTGDDTAVVKVTGQAAGAATGITLNGAPAKFNERGELCNDGTAWNKSASGSWHDADNWTDGVPSSGKATRINVRGDFAVRVDAAAASGNLLVKNVSGRTTLAVSNDYPISTASVTLDKGAELLVGEGGRAIWSGLTGMTFREGGRLTVDGGTVEVSGATAVSDISSSDPGNPSGIAVKDGTFKYMVPSSAYPLTLGDGARLDVSGGTNVIAWSNWFATLMKVTGGMTHVFSGDAAWLFSSTTCGGIYADGTFAFADNALMTCDFGSSYNLIFAPLTADGLCELSFSDHAKVDSIRILLYLGCPGSAMSATEAGTRVVFDSEATSTVGCIWAGIERTSVAEVVVKRGRVDVGSYGINLGTTWEGYYCKDSAARGVFKMQGGVLTVGGLGYKGYNSFLSGIGVGNGCNDGTKGNVPYHFSGRFELDGGAVTNTIGFLVVGAGRASGEFVQRGGVLCFDDTTNAKTFPCPQIIGAFTGDGLFAVSNGVARFEVGTPMYVGGLAKDDLRTAGYFTDYWPNVLPNLVTGDLAATGKVEVVDGELTSAGDLILGADGRGEIAIVGSKGAANFANAVFSNKVESVASFTLDADGVSPLALAGTLTVTDGATLNVDVSRYAGKRARTRLVTCAAMEGRFATVNLTGSDASETLKDATVVQGDAGVYLRVPRGALLLVR